MAKSIERLRTTWKILTGMFAGSRLDEGPEDIAELAGLADTGQLAGLFLVLANPSTVPILECIATGEHTVPECAGRTGIADAVLEPQLAVLEELGWIGKRHDSYVLTDQRVTEFIELARSLSTNNAEALMRCQHINRKLPC